MLKKNSCKLLNNRVYSGNLRREMSDIEKSATDDKPILARFESHFGQLPDPRIDRTKFYPLSEIFFIVFCGSICGAESWRDYVIFGKEKIDFLREYYPFAAALNPDEFRSCFMGWVNCLQSVLGDVIAIDGKTLCNSADVVNGVAAIHMVSAFAT